MPKNKKRRPPTHTTCVEVLTPIKAQLILNHAIVVNGRGVDGSKEGKGFRFDPTGRFDSFSSSCEGLEEFEAAYGFPLPSLGDHAFVFTQRFDKTASWSHGYVLAIKGGRLVSLEVTRKDGAVVPKQGQPVEAPELLDFLNDHSPLRLDDPMIERMWWVQEAQRHGLLHGSYPKFITGTDETSRWTAFPAGEPLRAGCAAYPTIDQQISG